MQKLIKTLAVLTAGVGAVAVVKRVRMKKNKTTNALEVIQNLDLIEYKHYQKK